MSDQDILVPNKADIKIQDRIYQVGALTLNQIFKLGKLLGKVLIANQEKLKHLAEATKDSKTNAQDLFNLLDLLEEEDTTKFFSIILKEKDLEFLGKELTLDVTLEIIAVLCEYNKIDQLKKKVQRIGNAFNPNQKSS